MFLALYTSIANFWKCDFCVDHPHHAESRATPHHPFLVSRHDPSLHKLLKEGGMRFTSSPARHVYGSISYVSIRIKSELWPATISSGTLSLHSVYVRYSYRVCRLRNQKQNGKPVGAQCWSTAHARAIKRASRRIRIRIRDLFSGLDII